MATRVRDITAPTGLRSFELSHRPRETVGRDAASMVFAAPGGYGADRRLGWPAIGLIVVAHGLLLAALCLFDVVHIGRKPSPRLVVMEIKPLEVTPPPAAAPKPHTEKTPPVQRPIMAPPPIVQVAMPAPAVAAAPVAPPAPPAPSAPAAPSAPVSDTAPPISAPDGFAKTLGNVGPKYPMDAKLRHQEGVVRLRVVINAQGRVNDISVARSSGFDVLDKAALEAVRKWRFVPGKQAGVAVEATGFVPIVFRLT